MNTYDLIHLSDDEWGNETMKRIAMEHFASDPSCQFVEVYEHAGWFLGFRRDGSIWTTANDMAIGDNGPRPVAMRRSIRRGNECRVCDRPLEYDPGTGRGHCRNRCGLVGAA